MNSYKKTFYFKNNSIFTAEFDTDLTLEELEKHYYRKKKKGKIIVEYTENKIINIIDLKDVHTINIERIDN